MSAAAHRHLLHRRHRHKIMFKKIITYFLILAVILPIFAAVVPLGTRANGAVVPVPGAPKEASNTSEVMGSCTWHWYTGFVRGLPECLSYTIVSLLYKFVLKSAVWIAGLAGHLFNASIQFSLTGKVFDTGKQEGGVMKGGNIMIRDGWTLVRDLLNLVFIFILLFAAISTILQYGNFQVKKILPGIIIAALLINFSLMITKMVIDASHVFAWEFYNRIDVTKGGTLPNMQGDITVYGNFEKKNLANVFMAGFNPQTLLTGSGEGNKDGASVPRKAPAFEEVAEMAIKNGDKLSGLWWQMGLIILLETALALFAGFILLAGAIMFIARVVVLWLVMIFSPLAFLGIILPNMKKYSDMWWGYLIGQSFFAPAFLFMFMLVTKFINSNFLDSIFETSKNSDSLLVFGINGGAVISIFFHFFVVGGLMLACLIVAREIGGKTASASISWAHSIKGLALGASYAGLKGGTRRFYAPMAENYATGKGASGKVGNWMRNIPLLGAASTRKAADIAAESRRITEEKQKKYGKYTADEMKNLQSGWFDKYARPFETAARVAVSAEKGDTQGISPDLIKKAIEWQKRIDTGKKPGAIERSAPGIIKGDIDAMRKEELTKKFKEEAPTDYSIIEREVRERKPEKYVNDNKAFQKDVQEEIKTFIKTAGNTVNGIEYEDADEFINKQLKDEFRNENRAEYDKIENEAGVVNGTIATPEQDKYIQDSVNRMTADNRARIVILKKASPADIEKNGFSLLSDAGMAKHLNNGSAKKILEMGGELNERMLEGLASLAEGIRVAGAPLVADDAIKEIAKNLQKVGNYSLAAWVKKQGREMVESYGRGLPPPRNWI